jgi:hypothetical protein
MRKKVSPQKEIPKNTNDEKKLNSFQKYVIYYLNSNQNTNFPDFARKTHEFHYFNKKNNTIITFTIKFYTS